MMPPSMHPGNLDSTPSSATFGQDASFRLEQPIGSMSISPSGRDVVLASKEGLHIVDLDSPYSPPRYLPHRTPWEVADVQWSPFAARDSWIVSTSNQKALVWNVATQSDRDAIEFVLHGHSRAITDINFSPHNPELLATCAVDSFVHGWDLRTPARPSFSFSDWFAGATQVKFNRKDEHLLASSHDRMLHIWDKRYGAHPVRSIEAHGTKIYGIDWNRYEGSKIATCSLDKTIKFWDTRKSSDTPDRVIETGFPVWRARHTPFGWGLLAMPQRDVSDLHLYDRRAIDGTHPTGHDRPVTTFPGHKGQVKEFLWRIQGSVSEVDNRDFQLVTWGADRQLRLHHVPEETFHAIGYEKGVTRAQRSVYTRRGARYRTFRDTIPEVYSPSDGVSRTDSLPSQTQFLGFRNRQSTNIGMSKVPVAQFRGWLQGSRRERRTGMHGKSTARQDMNPITWMKNVKIASWDPDSLADEITQVGEKFQKVEFDSIDITQRKAVMSVQGPWGDGSTMVYTRVDFRFPKAYPRAANAIVTIQKSNSIESEVHRLLSTEVRTIAETYASRQRGCIEAVVRYLLSEQTMEQIVSWLLSETSSDSKILESAELPEDLSSDSDDENLNDTVTALNTDANDRVPLPKACGAIWSNDGRLVCFFPKDNRGPVPLLPQRDDSLLGDTQSNKLFEAFGRFKTDSTTRRSHQDNIDIDDSSSELSDERSEFSDSSSSSQSTSSLRAGEGIRGRFASYKNAIAFGLANRAASEDRSNKSTNLDGTKVGVDKTLNVVSIHDDLGSLIPSTRSLAKAYRITGDSRIVCEHNAHVAEEAQLPDIASVWRLAGLILEKRVPLEAIQSSVQDLDTIVLVARRSATLLRRKDSGISLYKDFWNSATRTPVSGSIHWGHHPLASTYMMTAIFNYFEREADTQMLAMLSCVFTQAEVVVKSTSSKPNASTSAEFTLNASSPTLVTPDLPTSATVFRIDGPEIIGDLLFPNTAATRPRPDSSRRNDRNSTNSGASNRTKTNSNTMSANNSPEDVQVSRRSNADSAFAASRASLSALAQSYSRSPPSSSSTAASSLQKPSPSTTISTTGWAGSVFGRDMTSNPKQFDHLYDAAADANSRSIQRTSTSSVDNTGPRQNNRQIFDSSRGRILSGMTKDRNNSGTPKLRKRHVVHTRLHNQTQFDVEGLIALPLLDAPLVERHRTYRASYAEMLGVWCLWAERAEVLQLDGIANVTSSSFMKKGMKTVSDANSSDGLVIVQCCPDCGSVFEPIWKNGLILSWHCTDHRCLPSVGKVSHGQVCSICELVIRGLSVPCLHCGHITCYNCAQDWFGDSASLHITTSPTTDQSRRDHCTEKEEEIFGRTRGCPTGCGCVCSGLNEINVPWPSETNLGKDYTNAVPDLVLRRGSTASSTPSGKLKTELGLDTALGAMMALSTRSRAPSAVAPPGYGSNSSKSAYDDQFMVDDEPMPWASSRFTTLGRGIGGGLSRGLSNRSSDATIRKA